MVAWVNNPVPSAVRISRMLSYHMPRPNLAIAGPKVSGFRPPRAPTAHAIASPKLGGLPRNPLGNLGLGRAFGGGASATSQPIVDHPARPFDGAIVGQGGGRTDDRPMHVPNGSYVIPADIVGAIGEGNSLRGLDLLGKMFPGSLAAARGRPGGGVPMPRPPQPRVSGFPQYRIQAGGVPTSQGGVAEGLGHGAGPATPINASDGEFVIHPNDVALVGRGDINLGHKILDHWVKSKRKATIKTLSKLPGPAK